LLISANRFRRPEKQIPAALVKYQHDEIARWWPIIRAAKHQRAVTDNCRTHQTIQKNERPGLVASILLRQYPHNDAHSRLYADENGETHFSDIEIEFT
jgi:hypothetical protein